MYYLGNNFLFRFVGGTNKRKRGRPHRALSSSVPLGPGSPSSMGMKCLYTWWRGGGRENGREESGRGRRRESFPIDVGTDMGMRGLFTFFTLACGGREKKGGWV